MKKLFTFVFTALAVSLFAQVQVTFQVDMTGQTVSPDGVHIAGSLNGWSTDANALTDQGSNIYAVTLDLQPGSDYEYKFLNGNAWGTEEAAPGTCTVGGNNRIFTAPSSDMTLEATPFNGCPSTVQTKMVTFKVDMTGQTVSANGVHVAGNFNAWTPGATALADAGSGIYEVTVPVLSSLQVLQYKFINGNDWGTEETPGEGCGNGDNNRPFVLAGAGDNVELPTATFGGCANPVPTKQVVFSVNLAGATAAAEGVHVAGSFQGWSPEGSTMTDVGNDTYEFTAEVMNTTMYLEYKYLNGNAWGTDEAVPEECNYNNNRFQIIELDGPSPVLTPTYEIGTCNTLGVSTVEFELVELFNITPTVVSDNVSITWKENVAEQAHLVVYDLSGKLAFQDNISRLSSKDVYQLNVSQWNAGMYIVQVRTANKFYSQKIIVE